MDDRPRAPARLNPRVGDNRRYDWAECFSHMGQWYWRDPVTKLATEILEEEIIQANAAGINRDRRDGGVVDRVVFPNYTVPDMEESWKAWDTFKERMRAAGMRPPVVPATLKEMKVLRAKIYPELYHLEKEAINNHERKAYELRAQKSEYKPSTSDDWKSRNWSGTPEG